MMISILLIVISKWLLIFSLLLFVSLDILFHSKIYIAVIHFNRLNLIIMILVGISLVQMLPTYFVPEQYVSHFSQRGAGSNHYLLLFNTPVIGFFLKTMYAALSPFPWANFDQYDIYGGNFMFLIIHILSSVLDIWIIVSVLVNFRLILKGNPDIKLIVFLGLATMSSLAFSGIGFHVYLAPALPFLATCFAIKQNRISIFYPIVVCTFMEVIAQLARIIRW